MKLKSIKKYFIRVLKTKDIDDRIIKMYKFLAVLDKYKEKNSLKNYKSKRGNVFDDIEMMESHIRRYLGYRD